MSPFLEVLQVFAEHSGVRGEPLPQLPGGRPGGKRRLEQGDHHRAVVAHHAPRHRQVIAELRGVSEVVWRVVTAAECLACLPVHVSEQRLQ
jgi:hypothetical protein